MAPPARRMIAQTVLELFDGSMIADHVVACSWHGRPPSMLSYLIIHSSTPPHFVSGLPHLYHNTLTALLHKYCMNFFLCCAPCLVVLISERSRISPILFASFNRSHHHDSNSY